MRVWETVASLQGSAAVTFDFSKVSFTFPLEPFFEAPMGFKNCKIEGFFVGSDPISDLFEATEEGLDLRGLNLLCSLATAGIGTDFISNT